METVIKGLRILGKSKKLIMSVGMAGMMAVMAIGATVAFFTDTEVSSANTFKAGKLNLKIDNTCNYNGKECTFDAGSGKYFWTGTQEECFCSWASKDLTNELFFNFQDVKPGDSGEDTISLAVENNPAWVCADLSNIKNYDNGCDSPESLVDNPVTSCGIPGEGQGELQDNLFFTVWKDTDCDNVLDAGEQKILDSAKAIPTLIPIADSTTGSGPIPGDSSRTCYGFSWNVPLATGNIIQTDSVTGDIRFAAIQSRHMDNFKCSDLFTEVCDGVDNDYDTQVDEGALWANKGQACTVGLGQCQATGTFICNASNSSGPSICSATAGTPGTEVCDGIDNDCDGQVDENNPGGGGACNSGQSGACAAGTMHCQNGALVCVQNVQSTTEVCDGIDNNCNGQVDENNPGGGGNCTTGKAGVCSSGTVACQGGALTCTQNFQQATEICDGLDNNCDGSVDEGVKNTYYRDADGDGYGNLAVTTQACSAPTGYVSNSTDCNDANASIKPSATEITGDGVDQNCDGRETCYADNDNDGYRTTNTVSSNDSDCSDSGEASTWVGTDCNDSNYNINPTAQELCNNVDDNCNGMVDESFPEQWTTCWWGQWGAHADYSCVNGSVVCVGH